MTAAPAQPSIADRLRDVVVSLRGELDISRHVFRDGPAYVVRDPVTFATHRFDPDDYRVITALREDSTLSQTYSQLVAHGVLTDEDEEDFYALILELHQRSLLSLPVNDADTLFQRFERKRRAEHLSKVLGVFFLRVPLINPDQFLARTLPLFRWLFTTPAFIAWLLLATAAGIVAFSRFDELSAPVLTMLDGNNVYMLFAALLGLKVIHEFGHAYACRSFGGRVPEMGVFLVLFTPLAYVDATDSWTFTKTRRRAIVTLGGVYFESIIGAIAVFVWAATDASTLNTLAYQVIVLATVTTTLFNLNPLLRYDAYYLVSDLSGVPNLRARCQEAVAGLFKRVLFGLKQTASGEPVQLHPGLTTFGLAQISYRVVLMITISTVLVMKFGGAGLIMAILLNALTLGKAFLKLVRYLISSEEIAPVRPRAILTTAAATAGLTAGVLLLPMPWPINARGVVSFESVSTLRAPQRGVLTALPARQGEALRRGSPIATLYNPELQTRQHTLLAEHDLANSRRTLAATYSPSEAAKTQLASQQTASQLEDVGLHLASLEVTAPADGRVLELAVRKTGVALQQGEPIAVYGSGAPEAVFHIRAAEFESLQLALGDAVVCRSPVFPTRDITGTVIDIGRTGTRTISADTARLAPGGLVPLNAATGHAADPYFEVRLRLAPDDAELAGSELRAQLPSLPRTTATLLDRRIRRFLNRMKEGSGS
ncbi:MAG: efflux RND transporter periplasmic adaptor subunit [Phycisphaerales bacterium JB054]